MLTKNQNMNQMVTQENGSHYLNSHNFGSRKNLMII